MKNNLQLVLSNAQKRISPYYHYLSLGLAGLAIFGFWFNTWYMYDLANGVYADELYHLDQIKLFITDFPKKLDFLTVIPGMHFLQYVFVALPFGTEELKHFRLFQAFGSFFLAFSGFLCLKTLWPNDKSNIIRGLQYALYPMIWFLHFPIYTGGWAIGFAMLSLALWMRGRYWISAFLLAIAILVRQSVIVLLPLLPIITYLQQNINPFAHLSTQKVLNWIKKIYPIALVALGFVGYLLWNGDVASGSNGDHSFGIYPQNFVFFMILLSGFWLPTVLYGIFQERKSILYKLLQNPLPYALAVLCFAWAFQAGFAVNHRFIELMVENGSATMQWKLLEPTLDNTGMYVLTLSAAMLSFVWFLFVGMKVFTGFIVKMLVIMTMVPFPFMSPRYSAFGAVIMLVFRRPMPILIELIQLLWLIPFVKFFGELVSENGGLWQPM